MTTLAAEALAAARQYSAPELPEEGPNTDVDEATTARIEELAALDPVSYDRQRKQAADELDIRVQTLDSLVERERGGESKDDNLQGSAIAFEETKPWPFPVAGGDLLNDLETFVRRYVICPDEAALAVALWTMFTWVHDAFTVSPILAVTSPDKRCGKTSLLGVLRLLVHRPLSASNVTPAVIFRVIEAHAPTLLIDEADSFLRENEELRGVLNSGHSRSSAFVLRLAGDDYETREFCTWAAKAIALIGNLPDTLTDRSIPIAMRRKKPDETVERMRIDRPPDAADLRRRCARWATDHIEELRVTDPKVPADLHDRAADNWRPLLTIAEAAGGDWPARTMTAAVTLNAGDNDSDSKGTLLLADIRAIFEERHVDRISSAELVESLVSLKERPWPEYRRGKPITARGVAQLLRPFGMSTTTLRGTSGDGKPARGYKLEDFKDPFSRYLADLSVTSLQTPQDAGFSEILSVTEDSFVTDKNGRKTVLYADCNDVTDETGVSREKGTKERLL